MTNIIMEMQTFRFQFYVVKRLMTYAINSIYIGKNMSFESNTRGFKFCLSVKCRI